MKSEPWRNATAAVLLVALVPWCLGCVTGFHVRSAPGDPEGTSTGALEVRVYENGSARRHDSLSDRTVTVELYTRGPGPEKLVHRDTAARWTVSGLAPGRYRLLVWWPDEKGARDGSRPSRKRVEVVAGRATVANVVLKDAEKSWVSATAAITVFFVGLAVILKLSDWSPIGDFSLDVGR